MYNQECHWFVWFLNDLRLEKGACGQSQSQQRLIMFENIHREKGARGPSWPISNETKTKFTGFHWTSPEDTKIPRNCIKLMKFYWFSMKINKSAKAIASGSVEMNKSKINLFLLSKFYPMERFTSPPTPSGPWLGQLDLIQPRTNSVKVCVIDVTLMDST